MEYIERKINEAPEVVAEYTELGQLYEQKYAYYYLFIKYFSSFMIFLLCFDRLWHQLAVKVEELLFRHPHFSGNNALEVLKIFTFNRIPEFLKLKVNSF